MADPVPRVSVLISVLNGADYLAESLDSVFAQTLRDFELIVVDNGSTDATPQIIATYSDPRLVAVRNYTTLSLAASLNRGLRIARAPLVARLDADDIALPQRLQVQADMMERNGDLALLASGWIDFVDSDGQRHCTPSPPLPSDQAVLLDTLAGINLIAHPTVMLRREMVLDAGGYPEDFAYAQDYALWLTLAEHHGLALIDDHLVLIRIHAGQLSSVQSWAATRLIEVIRLHRKALTLPGLSRHGRAAAQRSLASASLRLARLRAAEGVPLAALENAGTGLLAAARALLGGRL